MNMSNKKWPYEMLNYYFILNDFATFEKKKKNVQRNFTSILLNKFHQLNTYLFHSID